MKQSDNPRSRFTMDLLPIISSAGSRPGDEGACLPLSWTQSQQLGLALAGDADQLPTRLTRLMVYCPALALWTLSSASAESLDCEQTRLFRAPTIRSTAQWLSETWPTRLQWQMGPTAHETSSKLAGGGPSGSTPAKWELLTAATLRAAIYASSRWGHGRWVGQEHSEEGSAVCQAAELWADCPYFVLGLASQVTQWLAAAWVVAGDGLAPAAEAGPAEIGPVEIGPVEIGPVEIGPVEIGPVEIGPVDAALTGQPKEMHRIRSLLPSWLKQLEAAWPPDREAGTWKQWDSGFPAVVEPSSQQSADSWVLPIAAQWRADSPASLHVRLSELVPSLAESKRLACDFAEELQQARMSLAKELAYGAGHEINNPLANIASRAQQLLRDEPDPQRRLVLAQINHQAFRGHEMILDMMLFAKPPQPELADLDALALAARIVRETHELAEMQSTQLRWRSNCSDLHIEADGRLLAEALHAMCRNSLEALQEGGRVELHVLWHPDDWGAVGRRGSGPEVEFRIVDSGPGIPPEVRPHLFDPFYSGREAGRGLGFGLTKSWRIAEQHGGTIHVGQPGEANTRLEEATGAVFRLILPQPVRFRHVNRLDRSGHDRGVPAPHWKTQTSNNPSAKQ